MIIVKNVKIPRQNRESAVSVIAPDKRDISDKIFVLLLCCGYSSEVPL